MSLTTDPKDERLGHGVDEEEKDQEEAYLVLSDEEIEKGFVRPVRTTYVHDKCGVSTTMNQKIAETYARDPNFYGFTYCAHCKKHLPVAEFHWKRTDQKVGS
jgi:hypothetical protein